MIFSLIWNTAFTGYWKVLVLKFSEMENMVFFRAKKLMERLYLLNTEKFLFWTFQRCEIRSFLSQKVDEKMIFIDYWKVLVFKFSKMGNTVFFRAKKLMKRWYLLITGKFLFLNFRRWEIRSFFEPKRWWKDNIYWLLKSSCFEFFADGKYGLFFSGKSWWKEHIYLVFLSFPWYSKTFVQCKLMKVLYWKTKNGCRILLILHEPFFHGPNQSTLYDKKILLVMLGALLIEMVVLSCISDRLQDSWTIALSNSGVTSLGNDALLTGHDIANTKCTHQVTALTLYNMVNAAFENSGLNNGINFEAWHDEMEIKNPQFKFWSIA